LGAWVVEDSWVSLAVLCLSGLVGSRIKRRRGSGDLGRPLEGSQEMGFLRAQRRGILYRCRRLGWQLVVP